MLQSFLADALGSGASLVTPNNRLARDIAARYDAACHAAGRRAWPSATALPWASWLERLWLAATAARATDGRALIDASAARELWYSIVAADRPGLLNARGAARHGADAWTLFHAWRERGELLERVAAQDAEGIDDDKRAFVGWADTYRQRLAALGAVDAALLPDVLATIAEPRWVRPLSRVVLHGFIALIPQQRRLIAALREAGATIDEASIPTPTAGDVQRTAAPTPSLEIAIALQFARARVLEHPEAHVAVVVADLPQRRDEVIALAEEILCPEALLSLRPDAPRPYGVSLGAPLSQAPIVAAAIGLIAIGCGDVDAGTAASALRSPFLPSASTRWMRRAGVERMWRANGQRDVTLGDVVATLRICDAPLAERFAAAASFPSAPLLPRDFARAWSDWIAALGWPGDVPLGSAQWQAREAWSNALARFAATGMVTGPVSATAALGGLRAALDETPWEPEAPPAAIRILGILEALGLSFDYAWLAGFDANRWPPAASPNPLLPLGWQRRRGIARAHPDASLAHARTLTQHLCAVAGEIIVSHAEQQDDAPVAPSPLFAQWPVAQVDAFERGRLSDVIAPAVLEQRRDDAGPALLTPVTLHGGASLFEKQSACPFQAFARYRLQTSAWDECPDGLSASERGKVLHAVMAAFWSGLPDQAAFVALDSMALSRRIDDAVEIGKARLSPTRWRALPAAVAKAETLRLAATLRAWLDEFERTRPPFRVDSHERALECSVEGIGVRLRIDRVDALESGGLAVIDYKSGRVMSPARWFAARPEGIQLALYAQALEAHGSETVRALAYAQLKAGEIDVSGLAESRSLWPALDAPGSGSRLQAPDWLAARQRLREALTMLAREIRDGVARVAPLRASTCTYCGLNSLCRIRMLDDRAEATEERADE